MKKPRIPAVTCLLLTTLAAVCQQARADSPFFLAQDLVMGSPIAFSGYEVVWPDGIAEQGLDRAVHGDMWTKVLFTKTLDDPEKRREVYANVLYALAARPADAWREETVFDQVLDAVEIAGKTASGMDAVELAFKTLAYADLRYISQTGYLTSLLNDVKQAGRWARGTVFSANFKMASKALEKAGLTLDVVEPALKTAYKTVLLNSLATDDAVWRLDELERFFRANPLWDPEFPAAFAVVRSRLVKESGWWDALARTAKEEASSYVETGIKVGMHFLAQAMEKSVAAKAGAVVGGKAGVIAGWYGLLVAQGVAEYREMVGVVGAVQHALLGGMIGMRLDEGAAWEKEDDAAEAIREAAVYAQYEFYNQMKKAMDGLLATIAGVIWKDIGEIRKTYQTRIADAQKALDEWGKRAAVERGSPEPGSIALGFVLDTSGSMAASDPGLFLQRSVKLLIDSLSGRERIYLVSFSDEAQWLNQDDFEGWDGATLKKRIESLRPDGYTNMNAGLSRIRIALESGTNHSSRTGVLLFSDGENNRGGDVTVDWFRTAGIPIYTISFLGDDNETLLSGIAADTGGAYMKAATVESIVLQFHRFLSGIADRSQIAHWKSLMMPGGLVERSLLIEGGTGDITVSCMWAGSTIGLELTDARGRTYSQDNGRGEWLRSETYVIARIRNPEPGLWTVRCTGIDIPAGGETFVCDVDSDVPIAYRLESRVASDGYPEFHLDAGSGGSRLSSLEILNASLVKPDGREDALGPGFTGNSVAFYPDAGPGSYTLNLLLRGRTDSGREMQRFLAETILVKEIPPKRPEPPREAPVVESLVGDSYYIQLAAYRGLPGARLTAQRAGSLSPDLPTVIHRLRWEGDVLYRVLVGPLDGLDVSRNESRFRASGYTDAFVRYVK